LAAIETQFAKLIQLPKDPQHIVVNCDDHSLIKLIRNADMEKSCLRVSTTGRTPNADIVLLDASVDARAVSRSHWRSELSTKYFGALSLTTKLAGRHNASNIALAVGIIQSLIL